jgi:tRNA(Ile)-lysidine synthase
MPDASLVDAFERALGTILARVSVFADENPEWRAHPAGSAIAVACSGGLDSSALLQLAHDHARAHGIAIHAFHIHHGISPNADAWLEHCERECARLGIVLETRRITLTDRSGQGIEQAARIARYAALGELCREHRIPVLLTAHHLDDQAETVLLQLLRGAGLAGCSGMQRESVAPDLLGTPSPLLGRPLLDVTRAELEAFVQARGIAHVQDESNADTHHPRNALRHRVMPVLAERFPGYQERLARSARHAQSAQRLLEALAAEDLARCGNVDHLDIARLQHMEEERLDNLLRHWLGLHGLRMPSAAWLDQARRQLLAARGDAQLCITYAGYELRRHRGRISIVLAQPDPACRPASLAFRWQGEAAIEFPAFGGRLHFEPAEEGVDSAWLREQALMIAWRSGGEKLKLAPDRPTRSLKQHYQSLDIPTWERAQLPLVAADGKLLYAAGIGMQWREFSGEAGSRIALRWEADQLWKAARENDDADVQ